MRLPGYPSSGLLGLSCLALSACSGGDSSTDHRSASLSLGPCEGEPGLDTMLDYARFDLRAGAAPHVRLAFGELLRGRIEICGGEADIELSGTALAACIDGDGKQLATMIDNLLQNAVCHGRGRVSIALSRTRDGMIEMRIEDDDEGIEPSQRLRVLQPSVRGESRSAGGHGLGLALVARIAERHRGTVSIDSSHSLGGACVCIPLPESELTRDRLPDALQ